MSGLSQELRELADDLELGIRRRYKLRLDSWYDSVITNSILALLTLASIIIAVVRVVGRDNGTLFFIEMFFYFLAVLLQYLFNVYLMVVIGSTYHHVNQQLYNGLTTQVDGPSFFVYFAGLSSFITIVVLYCQNLKTAASVVNIISSFITGIAFGITRDRLQKELSLLETYGAQLPRPFHVLCSWEILQAIIGTTVFYLCTDCCNITYPPVLYSPPEAENNSEDRSDGSTQHQDQEERIVNPWEQRALRPGERFATAEELERKNKKTIPKPIHSGVGESTEDTKREFTQDTQGTVNG